ncbi:hypothetical protein VULLAG_LOCUS17714 [Vulpes lagopus]
MCRGGEELASTHEALRVVIYFCRGLRRSFRAGSRRGRRCFCGRRLVSSRSSLSSSSFSSSFESQSGRPAQLAGRKLRPNLLSSLESYGEFAGDQN